MTNSIGFCLFFLGFIYPFFSYAFVENDLKTFESFRTIYNKVYSTPMEYSYRATVFYNNIAYISKENHKNNSYILGQTIFSDMTHDEFVASRSLNGFLLSHLRGRSHSFLHSKQTIRNNEKQIYDYQSRSFNMSTDWRNEHVLSPIKNQLLCGSCWAFSVIGAIESLHAIHTKQLSVLSEQQLVDCDSQSYGCQGGFIESAYQYIIDNNGICSSYDYPYYGIQSTCKQTECKPAVTISRFTMVTPQQGIELVHSIQYQPVSVAIDASSYAFQFYRSGIIDNDSCSSKVNHAVLAVGYNLEDDENSYIIIRNSWSTLWGESGYAKIKYIAQGPGTCGINMYPSYPTLV